MSVGVFLLSTLFSSFLTVLLSVCVLFLSGGASVILSLGLVSWCDTVTDHNRQPYRYDGASWTFFAALRTY